MIDSRGRWVAIAVTLGLALIGADLARRSGGPAVTAERLASGYEELWRDLDETALEVATRLTDGSAVGDPASMFQTLIEEAERRSPEELTLLVVDAGGRVRAWSGQGLLHTLEGDAVPASGRTSLSGFGSGSLLTVQPLEGFRGGGWRVLAGISRQTEVLPFALRGAGPEPALHWSVSKPDVPSPDGILARVDLPDTPSLIVGATSAGSGAAARSPWTLRALGALLLACTLLSVGARARAPARGWWIAGLGIGVAAWGAGASLAPAVLCGAATGIAGLVWVTAARRRVGAAAAVAAGVGAAFVPAVAAWGLPLWRSVPDLGTNLAGGVEVTVWRLSVGAITAAVAGLALSAWRSPTAGPRGVALGIALAFGAAHWAIESTPWCLGFLAVAGGLLGMWLAYRGPAGVLSTAGALLMTAWIAALGWETVRRDHELTRLETEVLEQLGPPSEEIVEAAAARLRVELARVDAGEEFLGDASRADRRDLAFEIWRHSPLARADAVSALVIEVDGATLSEFSYGLPLREGRPDWSPERWRERNVAAWERTLVAGVGRLVGLGEEGAILRYWLMPQPGFRAGPFGIEDLTAGLLRGSAVALSPPEEWVTPAAYSLYRTPRRAVVSPWAEAPPLPEAAIEFGRAVADTPDGRAHVMVRRGEDGIAALWLPWLGPIGAIERVGGHALTTALAGLLVGAILSASRRPRRWRARMRAGWRSYSQRLTSVYSVLVLLPVAIGGVFAVHWLEERWEREQLSRGQTALISAQRVLGEYVLSLDPGFGIATALDDDLLSWLSRVVHHEVNLYWGSQVYASSKPELFTAGLLAKRIPGEPYFRLTHGGQRVASRVNRTGRASYLELYAPLRIPGMPEERTRLFLSMPLLAQQEEAAEEIASLRRRALLGSLLLALVVAGIGRAWVRRFTEPLLDIVRGTQRIAAGARELGLSPKEREFESLAAAIDRMARRIGEARERLVREKRVVERVVENVGAAVISVDRSRRVVLRNKVARTLLGVEAGDRIDDALRREPRLESLARFVAGSPDARRQATVTLSDAEGEEEESRELSLIWVPIPGEGDPAALLVVEDVTEVLRAQRLEAWAEMARIIAHEIKNPLTPIRLSAEHMREVRRADPAHFDAVFERCTANILEQVAELQQISNEFSTYAWIPRLEPEAGDLVAAVGAVAEGYGAASVDGVELHYRPPESRIRARFDSRLLARAIRNLLENALRAAGTGGRVELDVRLGDGEASIAVRDDGPGVPPESLSRIFDPYFSTHDSGTGLGLPIAKRVAEEHGGRITARNLDAGGLEVVIHLPVEPDVLG